MPDRPRKAQMATEKNERTPRRRRSRRPRTKQQESKVTATQETDGTLAPGGNEGQEDSGKEHSEHQQRGRTSRRSKRGGRSRSRTQDSRNRATGETDVQTDKLEATSAASEESPSSERGTSGSQSDEAKAVQEDARDSANKGDSTSAGRTSRKRRGRRGGKRSKRSRQRPKDRQRDADRQTAEATGKRSNTDAAAGSGAGEGGAPSATDDVDESIDEGKDRASRNASRGRRPRRASSRNRRRREDDEGRGEMGDDDYDEIDDESSTNKLMLINVLEEQEARIAVVNDDKLEQLHQERTTADHIVGNIHKGVVVNLVPNIEAAFVEFGYRKHGFLHISDILASAVGASSRSDDIRDLLSEGQEVTVQVTKEGIGDKGPSLTTYLSLPGRYMVLMPGLQRRGVSRRIPDEAERSRIRRALAEIDVPGDIGIIARTAAEGRSAKDLQGDLDYLMRLWKAICERSERSKAPAMVYQESDPVIRVIRDVFTEDTRKVVVDSEDVFEKVKDFMRVVLPRHVRKAKLHTAPEPLFHHYGVEAEIDMMHSRTVPLANGGSIVIDQTEAMVTIDINSGHYKGRGDAEETAYQINMSAATEIARQIRLRDLGGVIAIDFIDMEEQRHRTEVERTLWNALKDDRARMRMLRMSAFCIVELTRQRQRQSLRQSAYEACPCCRGTGLVKSHETLALQALRQIRAGLDRSNLKNVELSVSPEVANYMNNTMRARLGEIEQATGKSIRVLADESVGPGMHRIRFLDSDGRDVGRK